MSGRYFKPMNNGRGQAATEYVLVAAVLSLAAAAVVGPGSHFFRMIGEVYRVIAAKISLPGNPIISGLF